MNKHYTLEIEDHQHNFSISKIKKLRKEAAKHFNVDESLIEIVKKYKKTNHQRKSTKNVSSNLVDLVANVDRLKQTYKLYIEKYHSDVDFNKFLILDEKIFNAIPDELKNFDIKNRNYDVKYIKSKNIFSFKEVYREYSNKGLTLISATKSELIKGKNHGNGVGKTSLVRLPALLLFGNELYYGHKKLKYDRVFNKFVDDKDAFIEGEVVANGVTYYIKREFTKGKSKITHKLYLYEYSESGEYVDFLGKKAIDLMTKNAVKSLAKFKKIIGSYKDFIFSSFYEYLNVEKWLETKPIERYRLFVEYLGLGLLEEKFQIAKKSLLSLQKNSLISIVDELTLKNLILSSQTKNNEADSQIKKNNIEECNISKQLELLQISRENLISKKQNIPSWVYGFNIYQYQKEIEKLNSEIVNKNKNISLNITEIESLKNKYQDSIKDFIKAFNLPIENLKDTHNKILYSLSNIQPSKKLSEQLEKLLDDKYNLKGDVAIKGEIEGLNRKIDDLNNRKNKLQGGKTILEQQVCKKHEVLTCHECGAKVDGSKDIENTKAELISLNEKLLKIDTYITELSEKVSELKEIGNQKFQESRKSIQEEISSIEKEIKDEIGTQRDSLMHKSGICTYIGRYKNSLDSKTYEQQNLKLQVEVLQNKLENLNVKINEYSSYVEMLTQNASVDDELSKLDNQKKGLELTSKALKNQLLAITGDKAKHTSEIQKYTKDLSRLLSELEQERLLKFYVKLHSDEGISKYIIQSVLPKVNEELNSIMQEMELDFSLEIQFNKKKIEFIATKSGVSQELYDYSGFEKTISCLALHYINVQMTTLPMPNMLILDEVVDRMHSGNSDKFAIILNKFKDLFGNVDLITHHHVENISNIVDNEILLKKTNNITTIENAR